MGGEYGLTIDLGTSQLTVRLIRLEGAATIEEIVCENPQNEYGHDIITRARMASSNKELAQQMTQKIRLILRNILRKIMENSGLEQTSIHDAVVVGNSVMHHLFLGNPVDSFLSPPYSPQSLEETSLTVDELSFSDHVDSTIEFYLPPLLHSFIGSDALAVAIRSKTRDVVPFLSIDVGTNTEIILQTNSGTWLASAPSGPAMEGMTISSGVPATVGAIDSVKIDSTDYSPTVRVIGNTRPKGVCGSGAVSLLAQLLDVGLLNEEGSLSRRVKSNWLLTDRDPIEYIITPAFQSATSTNITLNQVDIRLLQQSKAAIRTCIDLVLRHADCDVKEIKGLFLTGAFGSGLELEAAQRIGMLPRFENAKVTQERGGASDGAVLILTDPQIRKGLSSLRERMNFLDLMDNPEFDERFAWARLFSQ
jgi:uncharacterized 2Fe-2S/4Fe-4S cluster protein (DUF4445 family)